MHFEAWFDQDIKKPIETRFCDGLVFNQDNCSLLVGVRLYDNGEPVTQLQGLTCVCNVILPDASTLSFDGSIQGNAFSALLPQDCFAVQGTITVYLRAVEGTNENDENVTLLKATFTAEKSTTDTVIVPTGTVPDVDGIIAYLSSMSAAVTACQNATAGATGNFAASTETTLTAAYDHPKGSYFIYSGTLYIADADITAGDSIVIGTQNRLTAGQNCIAAPIGDQAYKKNVIPQAAANLLCSGITAYGCGLTASNSSPIVNTTTSAQDTSDFIPVTAGELLICGGFLRYWYYDSNQDAISGATGNLSNNTSYLIDGNTDIKKLTVPAGAAYIRCTYSKANIPNCFMYRPTPYEQKLAADITDIQLALVEIYEIIGG